MIVLWPVLGVVLACLLYFYFNRWRDSRIRRRPFPADWEPYLVSGLPVYDSLPEPQRNRLRQLMQIFIARKRFYGCAGLTITDEMRVVIAAQACLLLLNQGGRVYPKLSSVLVYPSAFRVERDTAQGDGTVASDGHHLAGESWSNGRVILSWDDAERGVGDFTDGQNVILHEFAHQLDSQSGSTNGAPPLRRNSYRTWANVFSSGFDLLQKRTLRRKKTVMDGYGATNPAEFFAVATETFFEKPHQLHSKRPELYAQLQQYYQLDPRQWHARPTK